MKALKVTYTDKFRIRPFSSRDAVAVSILDEAGNPHLLEVLWNVAGTNVVSKYCEEIAMAVDHMRTAKYIASTHKSSVTSKNS